MISLKRICCQSKTDLCLLNFKVCRRGRIWSFNKKNVFTQSDTKTRRIRDIKNVSSCSLFYVPTIIPPSREASTYCQVWSGFLWSVERFLALQQLIYTIGLNISGHFSIQSPIKTRSCLFSRVLRKLHVITSSFDWFTALSVFFVIG